MRRLYLILVVSIMLLAVGGVAVTRAAVPTDSNSPSYKVPSRLPTRLLGVDIAGLARQISLSDDMTQRLDDTFAFSSAGDGGSIPGFTAQHGITPAVSAPELGIRQPVLIDTTGQSSLRGMSAADDFTVLVDDDFQEANSGGWSVGEEEGVGRVEIVDGKLLITAEENWLIQTTAEAVGDLPDGYIAASFTFEGQGNAGVVARLRQDQNGPSEYLCQISGSNVYACYKQQDGVWSDPLVSGQIEEIEPGATIRMSLQVVGDELKLSINDVEAAEFTDDSLTVGGWGVFASSDAGTTTAAFSHVQVAESSAPTATATRTPRPGRPTRTATPTRTPGILDVPSGGTLGGLPSSVAAHDDRRGPLGEILKAVDNTNASASYEFSYEINEGSDGPIKGEGQYVAEDKVHVNVTDPKQNEREAIIWAGEYFVKDDTGSYQLRSLDEIEDDEAPAAEMIWRLADHPNIFQELSDIVPAAYQIKDEGEVRLHGALTRHYTFAIDGVRFFGGFGAPFQIGTGEVYVELSSGHVYALNVDTDIYKVFQAIFIAAGEDRPPTPVPGTPVPESHNIYNLMLWNFDEPAGFERPNAAVADLTSTPAEPPADGRGSARRSTGAPAGAPDAVLAGNLPLAVHVMIGNAIDTMYDGLASYHYDLDMGSDEKDQDGNVFNDRMAVKADVQNPDQLDMSWLIERTTNGETETARFDIIRIGADAYSRSSRYGDDAWHHSEYQDPTESGGPDMLSTVLDMRSVMANAVVLDDEVHNGVAAHHIFFTLDMQQIAGEDVDLSTLVAEGSGDIWIDAQGGQFLEVKWSYRIQDPNSGVKQEIRYDANYSAFNQPVNIQPPADYQEAETEG